MFRRHFHKRHAYFAHKMMNREDFGFGRGMDGFDLRAMAAMGKERFFKKGNLQLLQMLEDREFVSISKDGKKKVYTITEEGQTFLNENMNDAMLTRLEQLKHMDFDKMQESRAQLQDLFRTFMLKSKESFNDEEKKRKFNEFVERTKKELEDLY